MYIDKEKKVYVFQGGKVVAIFSDGTGMQKMKDFTKYVKNLFYQMNITRILFDIQEVGISFLIHMVAADPHFCMTNVKEYYGTNIEFDEYCMEQIDVQNIADPILYISKTYR